MKKAQKSMFTGLLIGLFAPVFVTDLYVKVAKLVGKTVVINEEG